MVHLSFLFGGIQYELHFLGYQNDMQKLLEKCSQSTRRHPLIETIVLKTVGGEREEKDPVRQERKTEKNRKRGDGGKQIQSLIRQNLRRLTLPKLIGRYQINFIESYPVANFASDPSSAFKAPISLLFRSLSFCLCLPCCQACCVFVGFQRESVQPPTWNFRRVHCTAGYNKSSVKYQKYQ